MKYIIVSKNVYEGTSTSDVKDPLQVTEIATELIITRLYLIDMLKTGKISVDDTVVCIEERKCLYTNIFNNVMSHAEFRERKDISQEDIIDLLKEDIFHRLAGGAVENRLIPYLPFYQNYERDREEISNIEKSGISEYDTSKPFIGLVIRKRQAWTEKNMSNEFWIELLELLDKNNIKTFIFGKETLFFCQTSKATYVKDYKDWCTLVQHSNCKHVASTMTGGVFPLMIFGNSEAKMTIIDNLNLMSLHGHDPSFYNPCINFQKIPIEFIKKIPTIEEFYERITADL